MFPGNLALLLGADKDEVGDRSVRRDRVGLNPEDDILDPEFFGGDPGGQHGDFLVGGGEGRVGQIGAEKAEAARPVLLGRRPAAAEVVMEKAVEEILGGRVAGIGLSLDRLIGQGLSPADNAELTIIRSAAVLCSRGGEVAAMRLFELLDLEPDAANRALRRLIDEHLVRESGAGVLGGLHILRSDALVRASHDETVFLTADTLWRSLPATTSETLPRVVQSVLADSGADNEPQLLRKLADMLGNSHDIDQWAAILTGLGLATLERHVASFMSILEQHGVQRAHWLLASAFADPQLDIPALPGAEQLKRLQNAILAFRAFPKHDLRAACLELLPEGIEPPHSDGISQTNRLLSCLVPICGGDPIRIALGHEFPADPDPDVRRIARLLSTARLIDPGLAESLVESLGGEEVLFDLFRTQIPWTTPPIIEPASSHGRTVRSNWYQAAEQHQSDPHETVCEICETLIALSPNSDAAASDAVDPMGRTIAIGDFKPWSKNMPRANIPAKARVAWNVAFRQILLARAAADSLTNYTRQMALLVRSTEKVFRSLAEKWIKGKRISNADALASEINRIVVNALAYAAPENPPSAMTEPVRAGTNDTLGSFLTGVLGNLSGRLSKLETAKAHRHVCWKLRRSGTRASSIRHLAHHVLTTAEGTRQALGAPWRRVLHPA